MPFLRSLLLLLALAPLAQADSLTVRGTTPDRQAYAGTVRLDAKSSTQVSVSCSWSSARDSERLTGTLRARHQGGSVILEGSVRRSTRPRGLFRRTTHSYAWIKIVRSVQRLSGTVWVDHRETIRFQGQQAAPSTGRRQGTTVKASVVPRGLNLRRSSTSGSGVITTLSRGTEVDVLDTSREPWWLVRAAGRQGYVHSNYLRTPATPSQGSSSVRSSSPRPNSVGRRIRAALRGPRRSTRGPRRRTRRSPRHPAKGRRSPAPTRPSSSSNRTSRADPSRVWDGSPIRFIPANSSNYTRSSGRRITKIVIHTSEGSESSCVNWFRNSSAKVSAHYLVAHSGRITQMVKDKDIAHHVRGHNSNSIGIENEGKWKWDTWTPTQMKSLAKLVAHLCDRYGIPADRRHLLSHGQLDPKRRSDPGPHFRWDWFIKEVKRLRKK